MDYRKTAKILAKALLAEGEKKPKAQAPKKKRFVINLGQEPNRSMKGVRRRYNFPKTSGPAPRGDRKPKGWIPPNKRPTPRPAPKGINLFMDPTRSMKGVRRKRSY